MKTKLLWILAFFVVAGMVFSSCGSDKGRSKDSFIMVEYGTVRSLDPAVCYDNVGRQRLMNLYEPLIYFAGSSTDKYKPMVAALVPTVANGGISTDGKTYTFKIRKGVKFHKGGEVTPEDVVYSFKRNMIADSAGGPMWMLLEALTGSGVTRKAGKIIPGIFEKIDKCVEAKGDTVVFHLPTAYPPFMSILTYTSSIVLSKKWSIANKCWDGNIANAAKYNKPEPGYEPLKKIANGTGAYSMKNWVPGKHFVFERFDAYWGGKPFIKTATFKNVSEWSTRKLMLQNGDADRAQVDTNYLSEVKAMKGVKTFDVPLLSVTMAFFCQKVDPRGNTSIGSGKLDGNGIPPNFFQDINVRKAFLHAMDRQTYKKDVFSGMVVLPTSPNIKGLPYHKENLPFYGFDLKKSKEYMEKAWGGKVWEKGFKMVITHNTGNDMRKAAAMMLAENVSSLNPKFKIEVRTVDWKDYTIQYRAFKFPVFLIGWGADYADPHNFVYTMMHSEGVYGRYMAYKNDAVDNLATLGIKTIEPGKRKAIYHELQDLWYKEALAVPLYQQIVTRAYRDNVMGFVPNSMDTDAAEDLKAISKK